MWIKILLLFFVFSFLFRSDHSFNQDLGRHLKLGEIILKTGQIPKTNLFSYTNPEFPFINTHWLFEAFVYLFSQSLGVKPLIYLKILVILLSVWLLIKTIPKENQALLLPIGFIFLHVLRERLELRPEIFSFLFAALTLYILDASLRAKRSNLLFILPLIQLIWINTHIYFFVGLLIQTIYIIHSRLKLLAIILILSVLISLVNPNGLAGVLYPLNVTKNYGYSIVENQTMFLLESINFKDPNFLFVKLSVGLVSLSLVVTLLRRQREVKNILLSVSGLVLALVHVRSFPYLVFLSLPATIQNFGAIPRNRLTKTLIIIAATILILESYFYLNGDYYRFRDDAHKVGLGFEENVKGAMDFVLANDLPVPIYNNFDIGSYILYRGYPKYRVFIDGRPEAYPAQFFSDVYIPTQSDYVKFKDLERQWDFKTIIFSHTDQTPWGRNFLQNVVKDEGWKLVYIDDFVLILIKENLKPIDLSKLSPNSFKFDNHIPYLRLGLFLLSTGYTDSGRQFMSKAFQVFPDSPILTSQNNKFFW